MLHIEDVSNESFRKILSLKHASNISKFHKFRHLAENQIIPASARVTSSDFA